VHSLPTLQAASTRRSANGALLFNTTGIDNTANGTNALVNNTTGSHNTAVGFNAGGNVVTADNVTCIGFLVDGADVSDTTWIGNVYGVTTQSGTTAPVIVSDTGQLGTIASSERFKKDIAAMQGASEAILALRPVTFHYKSDTKDTPQFGLIAEEVAKVNPALVLPDKEGKPYTVRYEAVNAMLLNEFLKEHRRVEELKSAIAQERQEFEAAIVLQQKQPRLSSRA
jgi:Chaperone of endosialidase